jgi:hypothetical protein
VKEEMLMRTAIFCLTILLLFAFPISGKTAILKINTGVISPSMVHKEIKMRLSEKGENEDDPATDDGEDLRDGDSDSNSNDDSDKDNG